MIFKPQRLGSTALREEELVSDKKACRKFGPCGVGKKAIYLNSFYIDRQYYVPISSVSRIFKRVAMSKGGFTGKGVFGSLPYLVVEYDDGREKQCNFKHEEDVDRLIAYIEQEFPDIPVHSAEAQRKLDEKAKRLALKQQERDISDEAKADIAMLEKAEKYLHGKSDLYLNLSQSAKKKRVYERSNPAYKWVALAITIMGVQHLYMEYMPWQHRPGSEYIFCCSDLQRYSCFPVPVFSQHHIITEGILKDVC